MDRWEYKTIVIDGKGFFRSEFDLEEELNKLGNDGWELVTMVSPIAYAWGGTVRLVATFKRKL